MSARFEGLVAVVTGGASGIGAAIADLLAEEGASVAVLDIDDPKNQHYWHKCDVADSASVNSAIQSTVNKFGRLDIVVNNAGIGAQGNVADNSDEEWTRSWEINVAGMARVARAALPHLTKSIASTAGLQQRALYSATKGAVLALTRAMAADHVREGVRVNCVAPGTADTPWVGRLLQQADDPTAERIALEARQPHGRLVSAEEVARAVAYLADPANRSSVGVCLPVDGGMEALRLRPQQ